MVFQASWGFPQWTLSTSFPRMSVMTLFLVVFFNVCPRSLISHIMNKSLISDPTDRWSHHLPTSFSPAGKIPWPVSGSHHERVRRVPCVEGRLAQRHVAMSREVRYGRIRESPIRGKDLFAPLSLFLSPGDIWEMLPLQELT